MAYKNFLNGVALPESDLDELAKQTLMKYATAAARTADADLATVLREGMLFYLDDLNVLRVQRTTTDGQDSTIGPVHGGLSTWTPTIVQSATVTYTNNSGTFQRIGRRVTATGKFTITGSGTASNLITVTLPVTALAANDGTNIGTGYFTDSSTTNFATIHATQANTGSVLYMNIGAGSVGPETASRVGTGFPTVGLALNDVLSFCLSYEAAADG